MFPERSFRNRRFHRVQGGWIFHLLASLGHYRETGAVGVNDPPFSCKSYSISRVSFTYSTVAWVSTAWGYLYASHNGEYRPHPPPPPGHPRVFPLPVRFDESRGTKHTEARVDVGVCCSWCLCRKDVAGCSTIIGRELWCVMVEMDRLSVPAPDCSG